MDLLQHRRRLSMWSSEHVQRQKHVQAGKAVAFHRSSFKAVNTVPSRSTWCKISVTMNGKLHHPYNHPHRPSS